LKVLASVGGWTYSKAFHERFRTEQERIKLAKTCVDIVKKYDDVFDGLDIDLEYPCMPDDKNCGPKITPTQNDKEYFSDLMYQYRKYLPSNKLLTIATSSVEYKIRALDFSKIDKLIDSYNIMTYDFTSGSWGEKLTGHMTNPFPNTEDTLEQRKGFSA